jgi:6-pyruvoyltetrahydropterin/6-carboxytetrahydropterin synthase
MHEIQINHEVQVAHRLMNLPGKCQNIHGHSMHITLIVRGELNDDGYMVDGDEVLDFYNLKKLFRGHLDTEYDHHLLLNINDPFAGPITTIRRDEAGQFTSDTDSYPSLPGVITFTGDPTTENFAKRVMTEMKWIYDFKTAFVYKVTIRETGTNGASCGA